MTVRACPQSATLRPWAPCPSPGFRRAHPHRTHKCLIIVSWRAGVRPPEQLEDIQFSA